MHTADTSPPLHGHFHFIGETEAPQAIRRSSLQPAVTDLPSHGPTCTCWPCLTVALTELSLIWELISGIVQEQGGHFISSLL